MNKKYSRRKFITLLGVGTVGMAGYGSVIESGRFVVTRHQIRVGRVSGRAPVTILHLSDLHASPVVSLEQINDAIELGLRCKPDMICLTGDFITRRYDQFDQYAAVLSRLAKHAPAFACLGNHDGGAWAKRRYGYPDITQVSTLLRKSGIQLLQNATVTARVKGWNFNVLGLGDYWAGDLRPELVFQRITDTTDSVTVVLVHNPDSIQELNSYKWDLMLCGHTHGGQLRLPFLGTPFVPLKDHRFIDGLHNCDGRWVHVTRGVGNLLGIRINCPPEVSVIRLI